MTGMTGMTYVEGTNRMPLSNEIYTTDSHQTYEVDEYGRPKK